MKPGQSGWKNPYIDLVKEYRGSIFIAAGKSGAAGQSDLEAFYAKAKNFDQIICEPCCGSGSHLIKLATINPTALLVGFELRYKRAYSVLTKATRLGLNNVVVLINDASLMGEIFEPSTLSALYINFPDPWSKRRWQKHRLINANFISTVEKLLKPGGLFSYKTDQHDYFNQTLSLLTTANYFEIKELSHDLYNSPVLENNIASEFEMLFKSKGIPIHSLKALKKSCKD